MLRRIVALALYPSYGLRATRTVTGAMLRTTYDDGTVEKVKIAPETYEAILGMLVARKERAA